MLDGVLVQWMDVFRHVASSSVDGAPTFNTLSAKILSPFSSSSTAQPSFWLTAFTLLVTCSPRPLTSDLMYVTYLTIIWLYWMTGEINWFCTSASIACDMFINRSSCENVAICAMNSLSSNGLNGSWFLNCAINIFNNSSLPS